MPDELAPNGTAQEEEKDRRRRLLILWLLFALLLLIIVVFFIVFNSAGSDPDSAPSSTQPAAAVATTTSTSQATTTTLGRATTTAAPTVSGEWTMIVDVTAATGACAGEEEETKDEIEPDLVTIVQEGDSITVVGLGYPKDSQVWQGKIDGDRVTFGGVRVEDEGVTTASFAMVVDFVAGTMTGVEVWTWEGPGGSCPESESEVTASLLGP